MSDDPDSPELEHLFDIARDALLSELHTCQPGTITSYDKGKQTATVQLALARRHLDENDDEVSKPVPELHDVIVMHSGPGRGRITFPVRAGDPVLVHFCEASIATWKIRGGNVDDKDQRRHDLNDAIAVLAPHWTSSPPTDAPDDAVVVHASDGVKIKLGGSHSALTALDPGTRKLVHEVLLDGSTPGTGLFDILGAIADIVEPLPTGPIHVAITALKTLSPRTSTTEAE